MENPKNYSISICIQESNDVDALIKAREVAKLIKEYVYVRNDKRTFIIPPNGEVVLHGN